MHDSRLDQAVRNNAFWCDTLCRAHHSVGEFRDTIWINRHRTPPFYPNAVTLMPGADMDAQVEAIRALLGAGLPGAWAVKDSYSSLSLSGLGFEVLFEAQWMWRRSGLPRLDTVVAGVRWASITAARELEAWAAAWAGASGQPTPRIFLPALLEDEDVAFIAACRGQQIVAGAIANRTGEVVGLSNVFLPAHEAPGFRAGCITMALDAFPGLALVGYEGHPELPEFLALGFEALGPLRVWIRSSG